MAANIKRRRTRRNNSRRENLRGFGDGIREYWSNLFNSKDMPRGAKNTFDDSFSNRRTALTHARRRLERAYGMKGECGFTEEELDELRQIFEFYDIDSSKTMDLSELNMALTALGYHATEKDVQDLAALMDVDGDMTMDFSEFCMIVEFMREEKGLEAELREAFRCIDTNGCGYVTAEELLDLLMTQGNTMSLKEASELIRFVDKNGDGKLDYEEFMRVILEGKNLSRSTTFYSAAPSSTTSLQTASSSKSISRTNIEKELSAEELSASFKTAVSSNSVGSITEITTESVPMSTLSSAKGKSTAEHADDGNETEHTATTSLEITSLSVDDEAEQPSNTEAPDEEPEKAIAEDSGRGNSKHNQPERKERPKLRRTSGSEAALAIKVIDPTAGEVVGSVVLENPHPLEE